MKKGSEIRSMFLDYFQEKGHTKVQSSSLVPGDDPSLLFTNAGMVQFKAVFLGADKRAYTRATTSQKCVRAGGKHNDLENVGRTARHHTFFEMLGNFSFGDYFKQGAIDYAWDLLVKRMGLDPSKLYVSVHTSDDEAYDIWHKRIGLSKDRIIRLGDKDNFWAMGDTGPCGPCSEIIFDQGPEVGCGREDCKVGECDCDRYLEIWNLVFMQFNRDENGTLTALPAPNIDTGMGLERITAVLQGVKSNYDTDLFTPLISNIATLAGRRYGTSDDLDVSIRVIADHARASAFLVGDGVLPSNEGRGYVLRRIIRRAARHGKLLGMDKAFLHKVAVKVAQDMGDIYQDLLARRDFIEKVIANEEERFLKTLDRGLSLLDEILAGLKAKGAKLIPGQDVFVLYDTFGFPVDLTEDIARKAGFGIDTVGFDAQMEQQREKARGASSFGAFTETTEVFTSSSGGHAVRFVGYDTMEADARILEMQVQGADGKMMVTDIIHEGEEAYLITDVTPFYGESGGQVGDTGKIMGKDTQADVLYTTKTDNDMIVHRVRMMSGTLSRGQSVRLSVDASRRRSIMRHHSATHLLQRALRDVLGEHVHQSGSLVTDSRLRFDFTHFTALSDEEMERVEAIVNQLVLEDLPIRTEILSKEAAMDKGAMALFTEKYGEEVRVVTMGEGISVELCGGTHCSATGQIGLVKVVSESSVSAGLRRIEAIAGTRSLEHIRTLSGLLLSAAEKLKCAPADINDRIGSLQAKIREQENTIKDLNIRIATGTPGKDGEEEYSVDGFSVVIKKVEVEAIDQIRTLGDRIKDKIGSGVVFLASPSGGKATFMVMVTNDLAGKVSAGKVMKKIIEKVGGRGGGKDLFAQGGGPDASSIDKAIAAFKEAVKGGV
ncbi:MAG TPA: alanine--tRNA ligase [Desulfomonilia bacterium]|nr:alanine--tRNA ligase [Desulfomonilia bacterium]